MAYGHRLQGYLQRLEEGLLPREDHGASTRALTARCPPGAVLPAPELTLCCCECGAQGYDSKKGFYTITFDDGDVQQTKSFNIQVTKASTFSVTASARAAFFQLPRRASHCRDDLTSAARIAAA